MLQRPLVQLLKPSNNTTCDWTRVSTRLPLSDKRRFRNRKRLLRYLRNKRIKRAAIDGIWSFFFCFSSSLPVVFCLAWEGSPTWSATPAPLTHLPLLHPIAFCSPTPVFKPGLMALPQPVGQLLWEHQLFHCIFISTCSAVAFGLTPLVEPFNLFSS